MNFCTRYECDTCETLIDCRTGFSNREVQPLQFACPECGERISFTLGYNDLEGATEIKEFKAPFTGENVFVDLHLDFPTMFGEYKQGNTTFMRVISEIGQESFADLSRRLELLNQLGEHHRTLKRLASQYKKGNVKGFEKVI